MNNIQMQIFPNDKLCVELQKLVTAIELHNFGILTAKDIAKLSSSHLISAETAIRISKEVQNVS